MIYVVTQQILPPSELYEIISVEGSLSKLNNLNIVGLDTETTGLNCHDDVLKFIQLGNFDFQVVIDCTTINPLLYKEYLESDRLFIGHNLKFDLKFLYKLHIIPKNIYDTYLGEKLRFLGYPSGMHSLSLASLAFDYLSILLDKSVRGQIIWRGLCDDVIKYSAYDVKYLEQIREKQLVELKKQGLLTAIDYENKFCRVLAYVEYCGVKIDQSKWYEKMRKDNERAFKAKEALDRWIIDNMPQYTYVERQGDLFEGFNLEPQCTINWNSTKQVIPIFKSLGVDVSVLDKETKNNKDSIDAKVLKPQVHKSELIPLYIDYKEAVKVTSTYGNNFLKQIDKKTGRLYTQFNQLGADTTRVTSGGKDKNNKIEYINFLNLPADALTRSCFVSEKGNVWISIDYSGQESYLLASIANDKAMIYELTEGSKDLHSLTAYMSYKEIPRDTPIKDIKKLYHNLRQEAKGIE